ncbi:hypothetical protein JCGZ_22050 [Jatropha curcas]|uniref:Uncharacterized protein n=1 Tax=Jatropha curcas TaxID=180498 RepID=A0A067L840_JATCU|nr:hypothetical protein JCGZ_22050 [Jatropha curcas]
MAQSLKTKQPQLTYAATVAGVASREEARLSSGDRRLEVLLRRRQGESQLARLLRSPETRTERGGHCRTMVARWRRRFGRLKWPETNEEGGTTLVVVAHVLALAKKKRRREKKRGEDGSREFKAIPV